MTRAAKWFVEWWRREGGLTSAAASQSFSSLASDHGSVARGDPPGHRSCHRRGWGFDIEWTVDEDGSVPASGPALGSFLEGKMGECIDDYMRGAAEYERLGGTISQTQEKKRISEEKRAQRAAKVKARLAARKRGT